MISCRTQKFKRQITQYLNHIDYNQDKVHRNDSNSFERINFCHVTPCNGYVQMQKKSFFTDHQKHSSSVT